MTTPVEVHDCAGVPVLVKRDDLYAPPPAPPLAKLRGVRECLGQRNLSGIRFIGVFDTRVSKAGWGVAVLCQEMKLSCVVYYPKLKEDTEIPEYQQNAVAAGARLYPLIPAGRTGVLYSRARALTVASNGWMLPLGLTLPEAVSAACREAKETLAELKIEPPGTLVVSVGTGTILSGILLAAKDWRTDVWGITAGMSKDRVVARVERNVGDQPRASYRLHKAGEYYTPSKAEAPFPCHPYYDLKAWEWLTEHIEKLRQPVMFWNIGA